MLLEDLVKEMNYKGHLVVHLLQDGVWTPMGGCDAKDVSKRWFRHLQPCDCRIVDNILIFRCVR